MLCVLALQVPTFIHMFQLCVRMHLCARASGVIPMMMRLPFYNVFDFLLIRAVLMLLLYFLADIPLNSIDSADIPLNSIDSIWFALQISRRGKIDQCNWQAHDRQASRASQPIDRKVAS